MKTYKTIPLNLLLIYALSKDFDQQLTWKKLYDNLYIKNTNIYQVNILTLEHWNINTNDKVFQKDIKKIISNNITMFEIVKDYQKTIINTRNNQVYKFLGDKPTENFFAKLGYTQKIK